MKRNLVLPQHVMDLYMPDLGYEETRIPLVDQWVYDANLNGYQRQYFIENLPSAIDYMKKNQMCVLADTEDGGPDEVVVTHFMNGYYDINIRCGAIAPYATAEYCRLIITLLFDVHYSYSPMAAKIASMGDFLKRAFEPTRFPHETNNSGFLDLDNCILLFPLSVTWQSHKGRDPKATRENRSMSFPLGQSMFERAKRLYVRKDIAGIKKELDALALGIYNNP